jgi:hypothetical protein
MIAGNGVVIHVDPVDRLIGQDILRNVWDGQLTIIGMSKKYRVHPSRVSTVAKAVLPLFGGEAFTTEGGTWAKLSALSKIYPGFGHQDLAVLFKRMKSKGQPLHRKCILTVANPLGGDFFYSLEEIDRECPKLRRKRILRRWTKQLPAELLQGFPDLSDRELRMLLVLAKVVTTQPNWPSWKELQQTHKLWDKRGMVRYCKGLAEKGYIEYRNLGGKVTHPREYRFLKGPEALMALLKEKRPELLVPFEKEDDV